MSKELIKVVNGGIGGDTVLDTSAKLSAVRTTLENDNPPLMSAEQRFMISGAPLQQDNESLVTLSEALTTPATGLPTLTVSDPQVILPDHTSWVHLTAAQQAAFLNDIAQVNKGLTLGNPDGGPSTVDNSQMYKTTFNALDNIHPASVTSTTPRIQTSITTNSYFSKFAESMSTSSSNSASVSVDTPFGGGSASFSYAQSHSHSESHVSTYSVGTYNVNIAVVELEKSSLRLSSSFADALRHAVSSGSDASQFVAVVQALNKFGWYVPLKFNVGGVLYTTKHSETSSWSDAQSTTLSFGASFKASFDGIGGGAAYHHANTHGTSTGGEKGSDSLSFTAIGGNAADSNNYDKWSNSMLSPDNWNISSYQAFLPSPFPLNNMGSIDRQMVFYIANLIADQYANCVELQQLQPMIDCGKYALELKKLLSE